MKKWIKNAPLMLAIPTLVTNLILSLYLPDKVATQISFKGDLQNFVPKPFFIFGAPLILIVLYFFGRSPEKDDNIKVAVISTLVFIVNFVMIYQNL